MTTDLRPFSEWITDHGDMSDSTSEADERPKMMISNEHFLLAPEVAARWRVSTRTVLRLAATGALPCTRIGHLVRFTEADVDAYEAAGRRAPAAPSTTR